MGPPCYASCLARASGCADKLEDEPKEEDTRARETVEDRLDKLKQDVLKELEELERLELEQ